MYLVVLLHLLSGYMYVHVNTLHCKMHQILWTEHHDGRVAPFTNTHPSLVHWITLLSVVYISWRGIDIARAMSLEIYIVGLVSSDQLQHEPVRVRLSVGNDCFLTSSLLFNNNAHIASL